MIIEINTQIEIKLKFEDYPKKEVQLDLLRRSIDVICNAAGIVEATVGGKIFEKVSIKFSQCAVNEDLPDPIYTIMLADNVELKMRWEYGGGKITLLLPHKDLGGYGKEIWGSGVQFLLLYSQDTDVVDGLLRGIQFAMEQNGETLLMAGRLWKSWVKNLSFSK